MRERAFCAILLGVLLAVPGPAQVVLEFEEEVAFDRPESWGMKHFTAVNMLTGLGAPRSLEPGAIEVAIEGASIPSLSAQERTIGFDGVKEEEINRSSFFGRPRVTFGLPGRFTLDVSYVPPIELFDVEPHLFGIGIARPFILSIHSSQINPEPSFEYFIVFKGTLFLHKLQLSSASMPITIIVYYLKLFLTDLDVRYKT